MEEGIYVVHAYDMMEYPFMADYEEQFTKCAEQVLEGGVPLRQAVTVNNVTLTLVSLYSDAYIITW